MSDEDFNQIRPKSVPLSHSRQTQDKPSHTHRTRRWPWLLGLVLVFAAAITVFTVIPQLVQPVDVKPTTPTPLPTTPTEVPLSADHQPAPFAALLREQARGKAQTELAKFVELQLQLEDRMTVGSWGQADYDTAKALATEGDEHFVNENFEASLDSYAAATAALAQLIDKGNALLEEALAAGELGLSKRDTAVAVKGFDFALTIDPENSRGVDGRRRSKLLPEVIVLLRQGKNHELSGQWDQALETYRLVQDLDSATEGLPGLLAGVSEGVRKETVRRGLSKGFNAMDAGDFTSARKAFQTALKLDPDNQIALGGLEQVSNRTDLSRIDALRRSALDAEQREDWEAASSHFESVLALDANIQFAKDGRLRTRSQLRTRSALGNIVNTPDKLSSPALFSQAKDLLRRAESLEPRGALLAQQIEDVRVLIRIYSTPVEVTFKSDNSTRVTLSTIGVLGTFAEKRVSLRPGAYTVIGSRDGCRDVRESILVRPEMQPVEIRCSEIF